MHKFCCDIYVNAAFPIVSHSTDCIAPVCLLSVYPMPASNSEMKTYRKLEIDQKFIIIVIMFFIQSWHNWEQYTIEQIEQY